MRGPLNRGAPKNPNRDANGGVLGIPELLPHLEEAHAAEPVQHLLGVGHVLPETIWCHPFT